MAMGWRHRPLGGYSTPNAIGATLSFAVGFAKVRNPPTAAASRTITDGPQSTLSGHSCCPTGSGAVGSGKRHGSDADYQFLSSHQLASGLAALWISEPW